jgi:murein DD-endopeptidase MepM/ murein hydrolase activator NlpD
LDHGRLRRQSRSRADSESIDLGNEPPLSVDGGTGGVIDRRRISVQWFSGTILTGVCGAALMGGAVFASLDGETYFASVPVRVESTLRGAIGAIGEKFSGNRKTDRLPPAGEASGQRKVIRVSTTVRVGDREVVRVRPYVRVSANLSLSPSEFAASVPPFNAQKLLAQAGADGVPTDEGPGAEPDAEVSYVTRDLAPLLGRVKVGNAPPIDDILARVRDTANWTGGAAAKYQVASLPPAGAPLAYAAEGTPDPYAGFETRIVPENITLLPKTANQVTGGNAWNERMVTVKKGETIAVILKEIGATPDEINAIASALGPRGRVNGLKEGQRLRILVAAADAAARFQPVRVIVLGDGTIDAVVALSDRGRYVSVDVASMNTMVSDTADDDEDDGKGMRLYQSIYETALRNQIPRHVIESLIRIYSYDIDFQHKAQPGDSFDVLYIADEDTPASNNTDPKNDVLFAALTVGGEVRKYYRFQTPDDGIVDYYDETGKSAKKFLVRKPVASGIMRSGFGARNHPLLGYFKMHTGVDWAAPLGTPVYASGNGLVDKVGWESGYGKYVRIRHANGYETAYGHMTAFARSTQPGARVRQGQVIGYVGSTGLSTGPHLHYEILVNGRFVDPLRVKLPRGRVLDGPVLAGFDKGRVSVDDMLARNSPRVAQGPQAIR